MTVENNIEKVEKKDQETRKQYCCPEHGMVEFVKVQGIFVSPLHVPEVHPFDTPPGRTNGRLSRKD